MRKRVLILIGCLIGIHVGFAQEYVIVDQVKIKDSALYNGIVEFITTTDSISSKKEFPGFVEVRYYESSRKDLKVKAAYKILNNHYRLRQDSKRFPLFYSFINNRPILFYFEIILDQFEIDFTEKSKEKLIDTLWPYLGKPQHIIAKDSTGKVIIDDPNFIDESFNLHGGVILTIYQNGTYKLEKSKY